MAKASVAIIGAGPAGLMLALALHGEGIDTIIVERQSPTHILGRIRAGILERTTTELLRSIGVADRLDIEGVPHRGFNMIDGDRLVHIDCVALTGKSVTAYGQTEVTRDLINAAQERGLTIIWESPVTAIDGIESDHVAITHGDGATIEADFVIGCDGFHGPARQAIPATVQRLFERAYPFGWLGVLADVPPCRHEVIYASHDSGFALASMRSPTRSRYYVQVGLDERVEDWPDERFWAELILRLGPQVERDIVTGTSIEKSIAPLRSFVSEPMQHGRLFLAGDAAHIVPPTGAKGLNLASSDIAYLSQALIAFYRRADEAALTDYGERALARVWKSSRFSWYLTKLMHRFPADGDFERQMQRAEIDYIAHSPAMQTVLAENYVGLPL
ncbi:4-hydroxybenzoate 3-monooxygenase [Sphingomonas sp. 28-63-12]|uniref:4-hydroxybenzoate 3-monooxygenase n=1 Tax=Sphingomonas sp. 28-63-12 TaxID=1970434 RepID=UPI000BD66F39|nr:MAG: 4-hydroxybenzoate 3-monooxygenase [Sphingomonas sp. 28-63-12]